MTTLNTTLKRLSMEDEILVDGGAARRDRHRRRRQPRTWRRLQERVTVIPTVVRDPQADLAHPTTRRRRAG